MSYAKTVGGANLYRIAKRNGVAMRTIAKYGALSNINSGLAVWWKFDETSGTTAADSSGNGKSGTLTNMTAPGCWVSGKINNCLSCDATDDYVVNTNIGSLSACSVAVWVKRNGIGASLRVLDLATAEGAGIQIYPQAVTGYASINNSGGSVEDVHGTDVNICDNAWHHIVVTRSGTAPSTFKLYVDGALEVTNSNPDNTVPALTRLFVNSMQTPSNYFGGQIDDVRVYNRVLSADDVTALYIATWPNINGGLVVWWKFDETTGASAADSSGNGKTGTLYNMEDGDWVAGKINNCLSFGGTDEYAANTNIGSLSGDLTVSLWMKKDGAPASSERMFALPEASPVYGALNMAVRLTTGHIQLDNSGGVQAERFVETNICNNAWHHIVLTRTSASPVTFKVYLDGTLVLTDNNAGNTNVTFTKLYVASLEPLYGGYYTGLLDEVRVYNRALSADDVTALYNAT